MPRKARIRSASGIYHIMWRGANRQEIFHDEEDCRYFLHTINKYKVKSGIHVLGWCLMNNHVHLLIREGQEEISTTMKRIGVTFVWYYNLKYTTTGHLFQDRYKSESVETIRYLLTVIRYIHQNPMKAGIVSKIDEWRWSSLLGYLDKTVFPSDLLDCDYILKMFSENRDTAQERFKEFHKRTNKDECLDEQVIVRKRFTDVEARKEIKHVLGSIEIAQVKSLPKLDRDVILQKVKEIDGISQRQAARILGVSSNLIFKA
ncbi:transposase [Aquibacillus rhizosphaerae]|uniref:Transposase n=1 Tax=Aquibacillus rhizosphaerae TaxID=3051431 RepID=A0ABT7L8P9_9BACI|nr:transposase [Aquibacillus sp. LR5S19]MDL4841744.1 transposase [Aquibacillus sp. LR5S19]